MQHVSVTAHRSPFWRSPRRMWLVAAATVLTVFLWWGCHPRTTRPFTVEVTVTLPTSAATQIYFDRGLGLSEAESSSQKIRGGTTKVRLPIPAGEYRLFRFDPIDRGGAAIFGELRIVDRKGAIVRRIAPSEFSPNNQVREVRSIDQELEFTTSPDANDPQFSIILEPPLVLNFTMIDELIAGRWWLAGGFSLILAACLLADVIWRHRARHAPWILRLIRERPRLALALGALAAAVLSSYPVVFFGKSFVSPNTTFLLYDGLPSVPGYSDTQAEDARGADVGAMMWQHLPYTVQQNRALHAGSLPLWNRFASCGSVLFGQGQSMLGDPLHLAVVAANGAPWAFDLKFVLMKALFACGIGWCVWALTRDFAASAILVLGGTFIAFFNYRLNHPSIFSLSYSPWILVAWLHLTAAPDRRAFRNALILWYIANWLVITSGTVKEAYLLGLSLNITGALIFFATASPPRQKIRRSLLLGLASVAFILTSAPLWWSFLEALSSAYTSYDIPGIGQIEGQWLVGLFDDIFYREFMPWNNVYKPAANFLVLLGCLWAFLQPRRLLAARGAFIVSLSAMAAIALAFRFGPPSWAPTWILAVPLLRNVHSLNTIFSCIAIVHLCVLAGWGLSAARAPLLAGKTASYAGLMMGVIMLLFIPYFLVPSIAFDAGHVWHGWSSLTPIQAIVYAHVVLLPLAGGALVWAAARYLRSHRLSWLTCSTAFLALVILLARHGQHLPLIPSTLIAAPGPRVPLLSSSPALEFVQQHTRAEPGRIQGTGKNFFSGFVTAHGLEVINGVNALENRTYRELAEAAGFVTPGNWMYALPTAEIATWGPITDFLNVRYLVAGADALPPRSGYRQVATLDLNVLESDHCWPRAFFTDRLEHYATPADLVALIRTRTPGIPFAALQQGEPLPDGTQLPNSPADSAIVVSAHDYRLTTNSTAFTINAPAAGMAVLHENWLPGDFRVTLNGASVPYVRVNHTFKGVVLPRAGLYRLEFAYWPRGLTVSLIAGGFGLILIAASFGLIGRLLPRNLASNASAAGASLSATLSPNP